MTQIIAQNRKARFNYTITESFEAGLVLLGSEVKSLRGGSVSINESYVEVVGDELYLTNMHIGEYKFAKIKTHEERRKRKLLLNRKQITKIITNINQKGFTAVPLKIYFNAKGIAKADIGLAKGKSNIDKRHSIKEREAKREQAEALKKFRLK
ncbi:SsrA-binding protein SmpB [Rickettsiales bacterium LUAb2]